MRTVLENANVFNGRDEPLKGYAVIIQNDQIVYVGPTGIGYEVTEADRVLDITGKTVLPGLILGHWHPDYPNLSFADIRDINIGQQKPIPYLSIIGMQALQNALFSGYTGVVGAGCAWDIDASLKLAVEEGVFEGPRIVAAGRHINTTGNENDRGKWWHNHRPPYNEGISISGAELFADGADAIQRAVRDEIHRGVEIIKTFPVGGHGFERAPNYRSYTKKEFAALVEAAHERGARVRAHVTGAEHILNCIEVGVDIIDHGDGADDACIEAMLKNGTILVPSMIFLKTLMDFPDGAIEEHILAPVRHDFEFMVDFLPQAHKAGVKIVPGDDYGLNFIPHERGIYSRDLQIHVDQVGISARDVLTWATEGGAELMGRTDTGKIQSGKKADLLVVNGDPSHDISLLTDPERNLLAIVIDGKFVKDSLPSAGHDKQPAVLAA